MNATGKSFSSIKKWRVTIERLSGYEFKKVRTRVSRRCVQDVYQFTEEEFNKFVKLSKRINETNNLTRSVTEIWGDLKAREEFQLSLDVLRIKKAVKELIKANTAKDITISELTNKIKKLEERTAFLEEFQNKRWSLFHKNKS